MSTELATVRPGDLTTTTGTAGANLIREAAAVMVDAHKLATAVASTQMIPKHFQGKPDECAAAMLYGASLGLDPMQSVRQIYVVHGQAALYARAMVALVLGAGHEVWTVESSDQAVTVAARRRSTEHVEQATWTFERAKKAGYTNNSKYQTDPQAMLYSKAASEVCRKVAPDVLSGVYAVEELQMERVESERINQPARGIAALLGRTIPSPAPDAGEQSPEGTRHAHAQSAGQPDAMSRDVRAGEDLLLNTSSALAKALFAAMGDKGITSREDRLEYAAMKLGRPIGSSKELTEADARALLLDLDAMDTAQPIDVTDAEIVEDGAQ